MNTVIDVNDDTFEAEVTQANRKVLIDFWADWCGPCKALIPLLDEVSEKYADQLKVVKINVELSPKISQFFGVRGLPTLLLMDGDKESSRLRGCTKSSLFSFLNKHLNVELTPNEPDELTVTSVNPGKPLYAFNNDRQLQQSALERAVLGAKEARIAGLMNYYLPADDKGSPIAWLIQSPDIQNVEEALGIPTSVAALYEALFYGTLKRDIIDEQLSDEVIPQALPLLNEWLSAIQLGVDLTALPSNFAAHLTYKILRKDFSPFCVLTQDQTEMLKRLVSYHEKEATGTEGADIDRQSINEIIAKTRNNYPDDWSQTIIGFSEASVRSQAEHPRAIAGAIIQLVIGYHFSLTQAEYSKDELMLRQKSITAAAKVRQQTPEADRSTYEALPEYQEWLAAVPAERHQAIEQRAAKALTKLTLELHHDLVKLTQEQS